MIPTKIIIAIVAVVIVAVATTFVFIERPPSTANATLPATPHATSDDAKLYSGKVENTRTKGF
jgi:hypothetical protein